MLNSKPSRQFNSDDATENLSNVRDYLLRYCEFLSGSRHEAEDIVQATMMKALPVLQGAKQHPNVIALLRRIAKNTWFDHVRKHEKCQPYGSLELSTWLGSVQLKEPFEVEEALQILLSKLTSRQRIVFLLCEAFSYTDTETAELIGTSREAVKAALHRARVKLHSKSSLPELSGGGEEQMKILKAYAAAFYAADINALVHLCEDGSLDSTVATNKVLTIAKKQNIVRKVGKLSTVSMLLAA